ncbi:chitin-binding type-2 domain-containing protein [Nephila pilipes]|uniref:Chitin-binding type-2 domain-containing protein n=1 Tax=Nephila pilipes TaxID=299642 RepID=A0A8X6MZ00_NEPPI|nr:chitin-binding type-2 domain-containing protein [Nephila pilipes]
MMLPSLLVLYVCLVFGASTPLSEEKSEDEGTLISSLDENDFVFTKFIFDDPNPYPPYPHSIYPLFRILFFHVAKSEERIASLLRSLLSKFGDAEFLNAIHAIVTRKFINGDYYPYTPDFFDPEVKVQEFNRPIDHLEWNTNQNYVDPMAEDSFVQRTGFAPDETCNEDSGKTLLKVDSIRGVPGKDFPDYYDIPTTSFSCADKPISGLYADMETGCQVFHACWPNHKESFLCPIGTIFNQAISSCDYWYCFNCSLAPLYLNSNEWSPKDEVLLESIKSLMKFRKDIPPHPEHFPMNSASTYEATISPSKTATHSDESKYVPSPDENRTNEVWVPTIKFLPLKSKLTIDSESSKFVDHETLSIRPSSLLVPALETPLKPSLVNKKELKKSVLEILQEILKATESVSKETQKFLARLEIDKSKEFQKSVNDEIINSKINRPHEFVTIKAIKKFAKIWPERFPNLSLRDEFKNFPEIDASVIVKSVFDEELIPRKKEKTLPIVEPSKPLKPSEPLSKYKVINSKSLDEDIVG